MQRTLLCGCVVPASLANYIYNATSEHIDFGIDFSLVTSVVNIQAALAVVNGNGLNDCFGLWNCSTGCL